MKRSLRLIRSHRGDVRGQSIRFAHPHDYATATTPPRNENVKAPASTNGGNNHPPKPLWTTGRVLLFSAFVGALTYVYGINDASQNRDQLNWIPQYGKKKDLEKVKGPSFPCARTSDSVSFRQ